MKDRRGVKFFYYNGAIEKRKISDGKVGGDGRSNKSGRVSKMIWWKMGGLLRE